MSTALDFDEEAHLGDNIAWLEQADPDDWHRVADEFNWSEPLFVLDWIVRQKNCDIATALLIFWRGEPEFWLKERDEPDDEEPNGYDYLNREICAYVAQRVKAGGFQRSEIQFDPDTWDKSKYVQLTQAAAELRDPNIPVCEDLIRIRRGRKVEADWHFAQRYPERFHLSSYDEPQPISPDAELYERPGLAEDWAGYLKVEQNTHESLPDWLKKTVEPREEWPDGINAGTAIRSLRRQAGVSEDGPSAPATIRAPDAEPFGMFESARFIALVIVAGCMIGFAAVDIHQAARGGTAPLSSPKIFAILAAGLAWNLFELRKAWTPMQRYLAGPQGTSNRKPLRAIVPLGLTIGAAAIAAYRFGIVRGLGPLAGDMSNLGTRLSQGVAAAVLLGAISYGLARLFKPRAKKD